MDRPRLYLIDGSSLVYRAYYALLRGGRGRDGQPGGLTTSKGLPTGAVYGFLTSLRKLLAERAPDYVAIAFDHSVPTFRHEAYADYKANRKPMPDDLRAQLPYVRRAVEALRIPVLLEERYEADDLIGTLAIKGEAAGLEVVLVTGDKDFYQLLGPHIQMLQVRTDTRLVRAEDVVQEFGVKPDQVADVLALWGDPSDNIPGVTGIGEKGAKALIGEWGSLDRLYQNLDRLKPAQAARLRDSREAAQLSKELATIHTGLEVPLDLDALRYGEPDRPALHALCAELEFRALADELAPVAEAGGGAYRLAADPGAITELAGAAAAAGRLALDALVAGSEPMRAPLAGLGLAVKEGEGAFVPLGAGDPATTGARLSGLRPALADPALGKVAYDLKTARVALSRLGLQLAGLSDDVGVLAYLLDPTRPASFDALAVERLGRKPISVESVTGKGRGHLALDQVPPERLAPLGAERADLVLQLAPGLRAEVEDKGLGPLYRDIELPLIEVLARMEMAGVRIDTAFLGQLSVELEGRLAALTAEAHRLAGVEFNLNSPRQLGEILFEKMNIPVVKKTRTSKAASTDTEVLEELARSYDLPRVILEQRELAKLKGTYVDALPALVHPETGRLHTSYNQTVAATGRLSSSDPNLQNIPIRTELGRRIRRAFIADPGHLLVSADYSQIELRLMAHLSGDPELCAAFSSGADIHTRTAASTFGVAEELVNPELRRRAKVINFGILYGMSGYGLSRELGTTPAEANKLIAAYFERYAGVRQWLDRTVADAEQKGYVTTLLGRIRHIPEIQSSNRNLREYARRTAVNTPIQGTAADLIKLAMVRVARRLERERLAARLILQVHDELVIEAPEAEREAAARLLSEEMEGVQALRVPLLVTVAAGPNWLEAK